MARGPTITSRVKQIIAKIYYDHPDWTAKEIQNEVSNHVQKMKLNSRPDWPGLSAIQKELGDLRKVVNPRDNPWNVLSLSEFELPPESLPTVLEVWVHTTLNTPRPLTIREAKWVSYLYVVIKDIQRLSKESRRYAFWEYIGEKLGSKYVYPILDYKLYELLIGSELSKEQRNKLIDERIKQIEKVFETRAKSWWSSQNLDKIKNGMDLRGFTGDSSLLEDWWEV